MAEGGEKGQASKSSGDDGSNPALDEAKLAEAEKQLSALLIAASTYAGQGTIAASTIFCKYLDISLLPFLNLYPAPAPGCCVQTTLSHSRRIA